MNSRLLASWILVCVVASLPLRAESEKSDESEIVKLEPYVVEAKSLADAGFTFKARFRHHMIWAGIKELTIVKVGPHSEAKKAGLAVGERILEIRDVKVEGLGLKELQDLFEAKAADGKVTLLVQSRGSEDTRTVVLRFTDALKKAAQPEQPTSTSSSSN
jgi:hypothetical protein